MTNKYIKSPLNYVGGKYKLLPQILPLFPDNINRFIDLFGGGFNVGINVEAKSIVYNELETHVFDFIESVSKYTGKEAKEIILENINKYGLSKENELGFKSCREDYNLNQVWHMFYSVVSHAFNYQIRYNKSGGYNMPFGKNRSSFNPTLQKKFVDFVDALHNKDIIFSNNSFDKLKIEKLNKDDFVYCDPPYLITLASYNEQDGWNIDREKELLSLLDSLDENDIRFALSNVFYHKGRSNDLLIEWSKKYHVNYLDFDYKNASYHGKNIEKKTVEVLITNYQ